MKNYNFYLLLSLALCTQVITAQNHQEIEAPTSDVLSLNSTASDSTVLHFLNANYAPAGISDKRAYISTNKNVLNFGLSDNNTSGRIEFFGQSTRRMTMNADGRFGIGDIIPTEQLDVDGKVRIRDLPIGGATDHFITADANGNIRKIAAPSGGSNISFSAVLDGDISVAQGGFATYTTFIEEFDIGGGFDHTTGVFTAPESGQYCVGVKHALKYNGTPNPPGFFQSLLRTSSPIVTLDQAQWYVQELSGFTQHYTQSALLNLSAGNTLNLLVRNNNIPFSMIINGTGSNFSRTKLFVYKVN